MDPLNPTPTGTQPTTTGADAALSPSNPNADLAVASKGTAGATELEKALNTQLSPDEQQSVKTLPNDHDHAPAVGKFEKHVDLSEVDGARGLNVGSLVRERNFRDDLGAKGDFFNPKGGDNVVIAGGDSDIIRSTGGGFNTITTGTGKDTIFLGKETTARIMDFDPNNDRFVITGGLSPRDIVIAQGKDATKGALNQPLDSKDNALVIEKTTGHILASMTFTKASALSEKNFVRNSFEGNQSLRGLDQIGFKTQRGSGKISGNNDVKDRLIGGDGNDFLFAGDNAFRFETAKGGGGTEFPFPTDSGGTSELNLEMKNGVLNVNGTYKDFDGALLFSQGETEIDPKARILNGSDPKTLVEGFLKVSNDSEGNARTGTHLHFSPSNDDRGNFADATVVRFYKETVNDDGRSGTISGSFKLSPEEQAALLAGNLYTNLHTNMDVDGDGKAGFPTGENRVNFNKDVVKFNA
jgi:hypothetical protein